MESELEGPVAITTTKTTKKHRTLLSNPNQWQQGHGLQSYDKDGSSNMSWRALLPFQQQQPEQDTAILYPKTFFFLCFPRSNVGMKEMVTLLPPYNVTKR